VTADSCIELDLARMAIYRLLSLCLAEPRSDRFGLRSDASIRQSALAAGEALREGLAARELALAPGEIEPECMDIEAQLKWLDQPREQTLADYDAVFGLMVPRNCPPYESEYCRQTFSVFRSQHMADIAGFYRAFGVEPSLVTRERPDHISLELEFMAYLIGKQLRAAESGLPGAAADAAICRDAQVKFVREHLAWWLPAFAMTLRGRGDCRPNEFFQTGYDALRRDRANAFRIHRRRANPVAN
jgi:TorA maturation chaperone TorD